MTLLIVLFGPKRFQSDADVHISPLLPPTRRDLRPLRANPHPCVPATYATYTTNASLTATTAAAALYATAHATAATALTAPLPSES